MATKDDLKGWILGGLTEQGGRGPLRAITWHIWNNHERQLRSSGDLFVTWQYVMR
jgi:hypothetical protein